MRDQKETTSVLDDLIQTLKDGQEGFKQASEGVRDPQLKSLFTEYSQQRSHFATDLQSQVQNLGKKPETDSSAAGALHRGWINLKSVVTGGDDHAILAECERGEDSAVEDYKRPWTTIYRSRCTSLFHANTRTSRPPTIASEICATLERADYVKFNYRLRYTLT